MILQFIFYGNYSSCGINPYSGWFLWGMQLWEGKALGVTTLVTGHYYSWSDKEPGKKKVYLDKGSYSFKTTRKHSIIIGNIYSKPLSKFKSMWVVWDVR